MGKKKKGTQEKLTLSNLSSGFSEELQQAVAQEKKETEAAERNEAIRKKQGKYFHNPYNFIPLLSRRSDKFQNSALGDREPVGHSSLMDGYWSGRICVKLTTQTPLLIPDAAKAKDLGDDHKLYPLRIVDNKPYLAPTSIKGMLRSAYEAITNSRLAIFQSHNDRLAYRMRVDNKIWAGRIAKNSKDELCFFPMEPVKLLRYKKYKEEETAPYDKGEAKTALKYSSGQLPQHNEAVWVKIKRGKNTTQVTHVEPRISTNKPNADPAWRAGWACVTGPNCNEKKFERVFLEDKNKMPIPLKEEDISFWTGLIQDYQKCHAKDLAKRDQDYDNNLYDRNHWQQFLKNNPTQDEKKLFLRAYLGHEPGKTAWSKHVYEDDSEVLTAGTLCYAQVSPSKKQIKIRSLIPVTISRKLFQLKPEELLPKKLQPAQDLLELSPADRVFGWVNQKGSMAHKGQLRVHSTSCVTPRPITKFKQKGLTLTILGEPKETQARFYTAKNKDGETMPNGIDKSEGYKQKEQGLRGRKVYPHHQTVDKATDYWVSNNQTSLQTSDKTVREYLQPEQVKSNQNRSIQAWVNPNVEFEFYIDVSNLSKTELGALLWLLNLPENAYHRLGGGKPLGFGSVRLMISSANLSLGEHWRNYYSSLTDSGYSKTGKELETFVHELSAQFENDLSEACETDDAKQRLLDSFLQAAKGFDDGLPTHYPRLNPVPGKEEENFEWFTQNDRDSSKQDKGGRKLSLPHILEDGGLPYNPFNQ